MRVTFSLVGLMLAALVGSSYGQYVFDTGEANVLPIQHTITTNETMYVGVTTSSNRVAINSGGQVSTPSVQIGEQISSLNNVLTVGEDGTLFVTNDVVVGVAGSENKLVLIDGGTVTNQNGYVGYETTANNNSVDVSAGTWLVGNELIIGQVNNRGNSVTVSNSGVVTAESLTINGANTFNLNKDGTLNIGNNFSLLNAAVFTLSTNATILIEQDMSIEDSSVMGDGTVSFGSSDNLLTIQGTNTVIDQSIVFDGSTGEDTVKIADWEFEINNAVTQFVNWENLELTDVILSGAGELDMFQTQVTIDGGEIRPDGDLYIETDSLTLKNDPTLYVTVSGVETADRLHVSGSLSNMTMKADVTIDSFAGAEDTAAVILKANSGGFDSFLALPNAVTFHERYFLYDFALTNVATDVKVVAIPVEGNDISSSLEYAGLQSVRNSFNAMKGTVHTRTKQLRRNMVATEPTSRSRYKASLEVDDSDSRPVGPEGPGDKNQIFGMNIWAEHFTGQGSYDRMGNSEGFTMNGYGTTFGFDRLIDESLIIGANYTYARSSASVDDGGSTETETYWLAVYGEWFNHDGWFVDGILGYGGSDYSSSRSSIEYVGTGKYKGADFGGSLDAGKYLHWNNWAFAPYAGLNYLYVSTESHKEVDAIQDNAIWISGDSHSLFETSIGARLRNRFDTRWGRFQTSAYAEWAYDLMNDDFSSTLRQGSDLFYASAITPSAKMINTGIGVSWTADENYELGVGYDARFNENYEEHIGTLMINIMF